MTGKTSKRAKFNKPPVIEVVASVQFSEIDQAQLLVAIEELWDKFGRDVYKAIDFKHRLNPIGSGLEQTLEFGIITENSKYVLPRLWFLSEDQTKLIQLQSNRLSFNWRKFESSVNAEYSSYEEYVWKFFRAALSVVAEFSNSNLGKPLTIEAMELAYYNVIPFSQFGGAASIGNCINDLAWTPKAKNLPSPKTINFSWDLELGNMSNMKIMGLTGKNLVTGEQILRFDLINKGVVSEPFDSESKLLQNWFDKAHDNIANAFKDLTTEEMHKKWEIVL